MSQFQTILGIILIIIAVVMIALAIYNIIIVGKIRTSDVDAQSKISEGERRGAIVSNVIIILGSIVLGVFGFILVLPDKKSTSGLAALRNTRSVSGSVLSPSEI